MARRVVQASKVAALCVAIPSPIQRWSLWRSSPSNWPTDTVIGLPDLRKAFRDGPFTGAGSGALGNSTESDGALEGIDTSAQTGGKAQEIRFRGRVQRGEEMAAELIRLVL